MKIGVITIHNAINYGSSLQACALQIILQQMGHEVSIVDYKNPRLENLYRPKFDYKNAIKNIFKLHLRSVFYEYLETSPQIKLRKNINRKYRVFWKNEYNLTRPVYDEKDSLLNEFDVLISGSDQVWNPNVVGLLNKLYFLQIPNAKKKISYAASGVFPYENEEDNGVMLRYLKSFDAISVREKEMAEYLNAEGIEATFVCDPTFLLSSEEWDKLTSKNLVGEKYIFAYLVWNEPKVIEYIRKLERETGLKAIILIWNTEYTEFNGKKISTATPYDFLNLIKNAEYVVANSFHGTVFSILFHKQFLSFYSGIRLYNLLNDLGLEERRIDKDGKAYCNIKDNIDWNSVEKKILDKKKFSLKFLENALKSEE